ncbi:MAG: class IV adenylate cyclase [Bryobacterales bacterium]|nr:class IV adenylate cyclase [Bryobacterales bacterium]
MGQTNLEVEIKLEVKDPAELRARIGSLGWRQAGERTREVNVLFDRANGSLRAAGIVLRLREYGERRVLTFKGPGMAGKHKVREEIETAVGDLGAMEAILDRLGYQPGFRYEKFRTEFTDGAGHLTLDETPIGDYLELEGPPDWIDEWAVRLGYAERDYITLSYGRLHAAYCERVGAPVGDMVFGGRGLKGWAGPDIGENT